MDRNSCDATSSPSQTRPIKPTRRSVSGIFPFRGEQSIPFESTLERDFLIRRAFSPLVIDIIPQPVQIPFVSRNGRSCLYTPDYLVYYRSDHHPWGEGPCPLLVEVKPRQELRKHWYDMKPKFVAAYRYAREQGWSFRIHDESRIRDHVFQNILFLQRYKRMEFAPEDTTWILKNLQDMGQAPFHYLVGRHFSGITDTAIGISHIWHMLAIGLLECDMSRPLNNNTVLWSPHHE